MLSTRFLILSTICSCVLHTISYTQNKIIKDSNFTESSYLKISADYISNNIYYGRKDSTAVPYLTPSIGYFHRSGLFIEGSFSLLPNNNSKIDVFTIDGGYDFQSKNQKFSGEIYGAKYFFNDSAKSVRSEVKGEVDGIADYDFGPVSVNAGVNILFSNAADVILNAGVSHAFYFDEEEDWSATPTFLTNIGSLNFYKDYYRKKKLKKRTGARQNITVAGKNNFSILDYEFSLPFAYDTKRWSFLLSPNYSIPVNPVQYFINDRYIGKEKLSNGFYFEASAAFKFKK